MGLNVQEGNGVLSAIMREVSAKALSVNVSSLVRYSIAEASFVKIYHLSIIFYRANAKMYKVHSPT